MLRYPPQNIPFNIKKQGILPPSQAPLLPPVPQPETPPFKIYPPVEPIPKDGFGIWTLYGTNEDTVWYSVATDSEGSVYTVGNYKNPILTLYNSDKTLFTTLTSSGDYDVFLTKYTSGGKGVWAVKLTGTNYNTGYSVGIDEEDNVYITGEYNSSPLSIYSKEGNQVTTLVNSGDTDVFIVKYTKQGEYVWATRIAGVNSETGFSVCTDKQNGIYIAGGYASNPLTIYNTDETTHTLPNNNTYNAFLVKFTNEGNMVWSTYAESPNCVYYNVNVDKSKNVYVTGSFDDDVIIYNSDSSIFITKTKPGRTYTFIKYDSNGQGVFFTYLSTNSYTFGNSIVIASDGSYTSGLYYGGPLEIYNSDGTLFKTLSNGGYADTVLVKYDPNGFGIWATRMSGEFNDNGDYNFITINSLDESIYVTGISNSVEMNIFNSDDSKFETMSRIGDNNNTYVVRYTKDGYGMYYLQFASSTGAVRSFWVTTDLHNNIYVCGYYRDGAVSFYNKDKSLFGTLPSPGGGFLVKYK